MTRYLGCLDLIKPEIDMVRTILRTSSRLDNRWAITENGVCDAILAYNTTAGFLPFLLKPNTEIISICRRNEPHQGYVFLKPFRADELIDTLLDIDTGTNSTPSLTIAASNPDAPKLYRLKKWPPTNILHQHPSYMLMAGYLIRGAKSLQDLVSLSRNDEKLCHEFLFILQQHALLQTDAERPIKKTPVPPQIEQEKTGFISLLKKKLGLFK